MQCEMMPMGESKAMLLYGVSRVEPYLDEDKTPNYKSITANRLIHRIHGDRKNQAQLLAIQESSLRVTTVDDPLAFSPPELVRGADWDERLARACEALGVKSKTAPGWFLAVKEDH